MKRGVLLLVLALSLIGLPVVSGATCKAPYELEGGKCVLSTNELDRNSEMTIQEKCADNTIPAECCQPPDYQDNPACPMSNIEVVDNGPYAEESRYASAEEKDAYRSVRSCLGPKYPNFNGQDQCFDHEQDIQRSLMSKEHAECGTDNQKPGYENCLKGYNKFITKVQDTVTDATRDLGTAWKAKQEKEASRKQAEGAKTEKHVETVPEAFGVERFNALDNKALSIEIDRTTDADGVAISEAQLEKAIGEEPLLLKSRLDNIAEGQPFEQEMPKGSLLQRAILTPSETITDSEMTFTLNEKPKLLNIPDPDPKKYEVKSNFGLEMKKQGQEIHPLSEAMFYIKQPGGKFLRYDESRRDWTQQDVQDTSDGFIAVSRGNSHFAVVVEKAPEVQTESTSKTFVVASIALGLGFLVFFLIGIAALIGIPAYFIYRRIKAGKK